ncbi:hypothetical protein ABW20_dc0105735 [Dactylellina cionopaga]|nr:hypothetical protein ABW20_dc0105735 [Dactylellina cionopaga]
MGLRINFPPELADDVAFDESWLNNDPEMSKHTGPSWERPTDEEVLHILDKRQRERASQNVSHAKAAEPSTTLLEDTSRFLLQELLESEEISKNKQGYKKGLEDESESDLALLQRALNISVSRIQRGAKPGYHPLPFYLTRNSKRLDESLKIILREKDPAVVNKVCYNLLVSDAAPTVNTFNILLRRFTKLRKPNLARIILTTMFAVGFEPNAHTYAAMLQYLTVIRNYDAFGKAVTIMRNTFVDFRNPVLGAAELNGWSKFGDFMSMRRRLRLLQEEGLRDDIYVLAIELKYYAKRHMWEGGLPALRLLLAKNVDEVDHRALFWAFKLCVNCHQYDFIEQLKALVQEKRWPVEVLWTAPSRTRGLRFGYKGKKSGQVRPKRGNPPQWTEVWSPDGQEKVFKRETLPTIWTEASIPGLWDEYISVFREQVDDENIVMESRFETLFGGKKTQDDGVTASSIGSGGMDGIVGVEKTSEPEPSKIVPESQFKSHTEDSLWRTLVHNRKKQLLGGKS